MVLAGYKTIWILSLMVVVALASVSPVYAPASLILNPDAACIGATVTIVVTGTFPGFTSNPCPTAGSCRAEGLEGAPQSTRITCPMNEGQVPTYKDGVVTVDCTGEVSPIEGEAVCGQYTVSLLLYRVSPTPPVLLGSASATLEVLCPCPAVGGCVQPANTLALVAPWLAVIGLVGCIGTVVVVAARKPR